MENLICAKCGEEILKEELVECPVCWELYHRECWANTKKCLTCKKMNLDYVAEPELDEAEGEEAVTAQYESLEEMAEEDNEDKKKSPLSGLLNPAGVGGSIMQISSILLILFISAGVLLAVLCFVFGGFAKGVFGTIAGVILAGLGWALSVLVQGFGEMVENSQKSAFYLSELYQKSRKEDEK